MKNVASHILVGVGSMIMGFGIGVGLTKTKCYPCIGFVPENGIHIIDNEVEEEKTPSEALHRIKKDYKKKLGETVSYDEVKDSVTFDVNLTDEGRKFFEDIIDDQDSDESYERPHFEIVSSEEWDNDDECDKASLVYFTEDEVVTDEEDNVIHEWQDLVGEYALEHFGEKSNHEDQVFIRNNRLKTIYELVREQLSFEETVLNYGEKAKAEVDAYVQAKEFFGIDEE